MSIEVSPTKVAKAHKVGEIWLQIGLVAHPCRLDGAFILR